MIEPLHYLDTRLKHTLMQLEHVRGKISGHKEHDLYLDELCRTLTDEVDVLEEIKRVVSGQTPKLFCGSDSSTFGSGHFDHLKDEEENPPVTGYGLH